MKKTLAFLALLFAALLLFSCGDSIEYEYYDTEDGKGIVISSYLGAERQVVIPERIKNKPVVAIADGAFAENTSLRRVTVPATVSDITERAFEGCDNLCAVFFEGDAPTAYSVGERRMGRYTVYFREGAEGAPSKTKTGDFWCDYAALMWGDEAFSVPFADVFDGEERLSEDEVKAILRIVPDDRLEVYPRSPKAPLSAVLFQNGIKTELDLDDSRLLRLENFYHNAIYHYQYAYTTGSYGPAYFEKFENDPYRLVLTYGGGVTVIVTNREFVDVYYDTPFGGGVYPFSAFGRFPYYKDYPWLDLFGFGEIGVVSVEIPAAPQTKPLS